MSQVINLENTVKVIPNRLPPIYSSTVKTCVGGVIELEESINKYSVYISEATEITIDSSKLTQEYLENYPLEFMLRVSCLSSFDITWGSDIQCSMTFSIPSEMVIQFNKSAGGMYEGTIISSDSLQKENLYEAAVSDIASTYVMSQSGGMRNPYLLPTWNITDGYQSYNKISLYPDPNGNIYFCVQFNEQVCATDFEFAIQGWYGNAPSEIKMWASNDGVNYVLYSDFAGLTLRTDAWFNYEFQSVGWYKYYKLTLVPSNSNYVAISAFHLRGFKYLGRYSENNLIIPVMNSLSDGGYEISTNAVVTGNLYDITKSTTTTDITLAFDSSIDVYDRYIKYTLPEATAADLMNFNFGEESTNLPNHFEVYGSIDDVNWDLIYGFQSPVKYTSNMNFMSNLAGNSYKYFKIIFIKNAAENTTFKIRYWQLSQRSLIDYRTNSLMPVMNSLSQDGYGVIPCSSWDQSTHIGWHVFDNNTSTYWATAAQAAPWFMVIKLPYPQVCNIGYICTKVRKVA